jgi:Mg2+-importing ATPase
VKILSGDNELVARHVCEQVGLDAREIITGAQVDRLDQDALGVVAERVSVFARVSPAQKHRIVLALKARRAVVGFLGDGINDAPSLHAADVGISVVNAVDVARDAADIVLGERDLGALHAGVIEGRKAFANVMKYLLMGTSSNFGNVLSMAVASLVLPFLPMLPTQILLNNFLYDIAQVTIPGDNVDASQLTAPRRWSVSSIRRFMLGVGPISSLYDFLTFYVLLAWLHASQAEFHTGWFVESLATQTLVLFVIRTAGNPLRSHASKSLMATVLGAVTVGTVLPFTPIGADLGFIPLPPMFFVFLATATATYLLLVELVKRRFMGAVATEPGVMQRTAPAA